MWPIRPSAPLADRPAACFRPTSPKPGGGEGRAPLLPPGSYAYAVVTMVLISRVISEIYLISDNTMTLNPGQVSIKVSEEGAIRYVSYDLPLLLHSNFVLKRIVFFRYLPMKTTVTLKLGLRSIKVIEIGTIRQSVSDFLYKFCINYGSILYHF